MTDSDTPLKGPLTSLDKGARHRMIAMALLRMLVSIGILIAVFVITASQPSSMETTASEAVPTPASTSTGTLVCSMISPRFRKFWMPRPEPIGAAAGMMATAPASSSLRA
jgi:hypothetical protein